MEASDQKPLNKPFHRHFLSVVAKEPWVLVYACLLIASLSFLVWWLLGDSRSITRQTTAPAAVVSANDKDITDRVRRTVFFESHVLDQLQSADEANREAAKRCIQRIQGNFDDYRSGVEPFVSDITGLKSRFGILKRMPGDWWNEDSEVSQYVVAKFEQHLFSEAKLTRDLKAALENFREDVRANQRELLTRTSAAVAQSDLPPIKLDDYETFFAIVNQQITSLAGSEAKTSVTDGLVALVVSEAGSTAVGMIAGRFVAGIAASSATAVAASGGATVGGAAAGAAGGSLVPGPGTIAGFAVGLVVGVGIDFWMNKQTAAALRAELIQYIDQIESDLIKGPATQTSDIDVRQGIAIGIDSACERLRDGVHQRLFDIIVLEQ